MRTKSRKTNKINVVTLGLAIYQRLRILPMILIHNHPSGKIEPSTFDLRLTNTLKTAAKTLDIKVLDHLIVTEKTYFSFADENLL